MGHPEGSTISPIKTMIGALFVCLIIHFLWDVYSRSFGERSHGVEIVVIDDFAGLGSLVSRNPTDKTHGEVVLGVAATWCLGTCTTREQDIGASGDLAPSLQYVLRLVEHYPRKRFIVNLSVGHRMPDERERRMFSVAAKKGVIFVAAAGNEGEERAIYPAAYDDVIAVGASRLGKKADYSNFGAHIDLVVDTHERTTVNIERTYTPHFTEVEETRITETGTSFAAPKLAGILGAAWSANPKMSRDELLSALNRSCRPMNDRLYRSGMLAGMLGSGELSDWRFLLTYCPIARVLLAVVACECLLLFGLFVFSVGDAVLRIGVLLLLACAIVLLLLGIDLAEALKSGYTVIGFGFAIWVLLYPVLRLVGEQEVSVPVTIPTLCGELKHKDTDVRMHAVLTLGRIGPDAREAIPALERVSLGDEDADVRSAAKEALDAIQKEKRLIKELGDPVPYCRKYAAMELGEMGAAARDAIPLLKRVAREDTNRHVREAADKALKKIKGICLAPSVVGRPASGGSVASARVKLPRRF